MQEPLRVPPSAPARLVVLASGTGSLLRSLLDAAVGDYPARVVAVGVDRECRAAEIAAEASVPVFTVRLADHPSRDAWDVAITAATAAHEPDLVVSAGFMRILDRSSFHDSTGAPSTPTRRCCRPSPARTVSLTRWPTG